jgi:hypothetical protein
MSWTGSGSGKQGPAPAGKHASTERQTTATARTSQAPRTRHGPLPRRAEHNRYGAAKLLRQRRGTGQTKL